MLTVGQFMRQILWLAGADIGNEPEHTQLRQALSSRNEIPNPPP